MRRRVRKVAGFVLAAGLLAAASPILMFLMLSNLNREGVENPPPPSR